MRKYQFIELNLLTYYRDKMINTGIFSIRLFNTGFDIVYDKVYDYGGKKMKCDICGEERLEENDGELICENCGAAYELDLLGYYKEGSNDRIEGGPEFAEWYEKYKQIPKVQENKNDSDDDKK